MHAANRTAPGQLSSRLARTIAPVASEHRAQRRVRGTTRELNTNVKSLAAPSSLFDCEALRGCTELTLTPRDRVEFLLGDFESCVIERSLNGCHGAEQPIEKTETDAEVLVHESAVVQSPLTNVVQPAGPAEPVPQNGSPLHPKALDADAVVQIAEDPGGPGEDDADRQKLVQRTNPEEAEDAGQDDQENAGGNDPFEADISKSDLACGCIQVLLAGPLFLQWTIEKQMVLHVILAKEMDEAAVQQAMQRVAKQLRNQNCAQRPGCDCDRDRVRHGPQLSRELVTGQAARCGVGQCRTTTWEKGGRPAISEIVVTAQRLRESGCGAEERFSALG